MREQGAQASPYAANDGKAARSGTAARPRPGAPIEAGMSIQRRALTAAGGAQLAIPDGAGLVHLQFRRFVGCAFCNMHLRAYEVRHTEIAAAGIREIVVFRSTLEELQRDPLELPYAIVLDPKGRLYRAFGVESGLSALFHPRAIMAAFPRIIRTALAGRLGMPSAEVRGEALLGFPADFLIGRDGVVLASHYGSSAADGWTVGELLALARNQS